MKQTDGQAQRATEVELRALLSSTEDLLRAVGDTGGEVIDDLRAQLNATIQRIRAQLGDSLKSAAGVGKRTRDFVSENPWTALGIGAAVGIGIGLLVVAGRHDWRSRGWSRGWNSFLR